MKTSEDISAIAAAMALAQAEMRPAIKDSTNPAFKSKYADLTAVWDAIRAPLSKQKIAVWQDAELNDAGVAVTTRLAHSSGQWVEFGPLTVPCLKRDAFGVGSATSYAKRYALSAAVGVVSDVDDDGVAASNGHAQPPVAAKLVAPAGFDSWFTDLTATADNGIDALKKAWTASKVEYRMHLTKIDPEGWEGLKAKAAQRDPVSA